MVLVRLAGPPSRDFKSRGSDAGRYDNAQGAGADMNSEHRTDFGDHDVAARYAATQPFDQPAGAGGVIEVMNCDVDSAIRVPGMRQRAQA